MNALISYCSAPGRTNGEHCVNEFSDTCPMLFVASDSSIFRKRHQFASQTLGYVCCNIDVLENKIDCVEGRMRGVRRCIQDSVTSFTMEVASANIAIGIEFLQHAMPKYA